MYRTYQSNTDNWNQTKRSNSAEHACSYGQSSFRHLVSLILSIITLKSEDNSTQKGPEGGQDIFLPSAVRLWFRTLRWTEDFRFLDLHSLRGMWLTWGPQPSLLIWIFIDGNLQVQGKKAYWKDKSKHYKYNKLFH